MRVLKAAGLYFILVFGAGFLLGMIRVPFLVPRFAVRTSELLEMPVMLVAIVLAARHVVRTCGLPPTGPASACSGLLALALALAAELSFAWLLQGQSPVEYIASRDPVSGSVYAAMLLLFALMPALISRGQRS